MKQVIMRIQTKKSSFIDRFFLFALLMQFALFAITPAAYAASGVTISELTANDVAILPGNPFYFFIKWRKGFQELFVSGDVEATMFELQMLGRKAAELKKIHDFGSRNRVFLVKALTDYDAAAAAFDVQLQALSPEELLSAKSARFSPDGTLSLLTSRLLAHVRFSEELREELSSSEYNETLDVVEQSLTHSLNYLAHTLDSEEGLRSRVLLLAEELNAQERAASLVQALSVVSSLSSDAGSVSSRLAALKEDRWSQLMSEVQALMGSDTLES